MNKYIIVNIICCGSCYKNYLIPREKISDQEFDQLKNLPFRFNSVMRGNEEILSHFRSGNDEFIDSDYYPVGSGKWFEFLFDNGFSFNEEIKWFEFLVEQHSFSLNVQIEARFCFEFTS